jgi:hypothetical protein
VPAGRVHEELERVEGARRRRGRDGLGGGADDHVALVEGGPERRDLVLGELVLVRERLQLPLVDEAALGGLLEQAVGRGQIVQMRVSQRNLPLSVVGRALSRALGASARGVPAMPVGPVRYL